MSKFIKTCIVLLVFWSSCCFADDGFFYFNILPGDQSANSKNDNANSVEINYKICDFRDNKLINCVSSQAGAGGKVGNAYGIVQTLLPNQRVTVVDANFFIPHQMYPLFTQSFPMLEDGATPCVNMISKNFLTLYADATGMKIVCKP